MDTKFQTRTGHLSHSTQNSDDECAVRYSGFKPGRATSPIPPPQPLATRSSSGPLSNPDGPPLPFHRESLRPGAAESRGFQTRTGHLSHSTTKAVCTPPRSVEVSNPDGPPLPFHPGMDPHEASIALQVSNPDGPPLPFHRCCCCNRKCNKGSFKPGRATSPIPPSIRRRCFWPTRAFQTRTGHLSHSTDNCGAVFFAEAGVSNPDGPPLPFHLASLPVPACPRCGFQTRTGHLSHSANAVFFNRLRNCCVSNPDGPPLPSHPCAFSLTSTIHTVSNPDGPPLPFHRGSLFASRFASQRVSNPDGPPLPFHR